MIIFTNRKKTHAAKHSGGTQKRLWRRHLAGHSSGRDYQWTRANDGEVKINHWNNESIWRTFCSALTLVLQLILLRTWGNWSTNSEGHAETPGPGPRHEAETHHHQREENSLSYIHTYIHTYIFVCLFVCLFGVFLFFLFYFFFTGTITEFRMASLFIINTKCSFLELTNNNT